MKNKFKPAGIITFMAVIGFSMAMCDYDVVVSEAVTNGRLTITGLNAYEGKAISAASNDYRLAGYKSAENMYNKADDTSWSYSRDLAKVVSGQVVLKVFEDRGNQNGNGGGFQDYTGDHKNVKFDVWVQDTLTRVGTVTVNFKNGIGSGLFVPRD